MQRTVGLDFGTHQTKICIEEKHNRETKYTFVHFPDQNEEKKYTLPSIIRIDEEGLLHYGYQDSSEGFILKYFKQATFCPGMIKWDHEISPDRFCIWYLAYIIFYIEEQLDTTDFAIQMGAPTDSEHHEEQKKKAVSLLAEAMRLVEEEFDDDKEAFLATPIGDLYDLTQEPEYRESDKEDYGLFVLPEAYACLRPLTKAEKIPIGLNLMIDVGGGTTDVSFFNINEDTHEPRIYHFFSLPKALNYLSEIDNAVQSIHGDLSGKAECEIKKERLAIYKNELGEQCEELRLSIINLFRASVDRAPERIYDALKNRPIVYAGGGSKYEEIVLPYGGFSECRVIDTHDWDELNVENVEDLIEVCPLLSTAYGLSIATKDDQIEYTPLIDIFSGIEKQEREQIKEENVKYLNTTYKDTAAYIKSQEKLRKKAELQKKKIQGIDVGHLVGETELNNAIASARAIGLSCKTIFKSSGKKARRYEDFVYDTCKKKKSQRTPIVTTRILTRIEVLHKKSKIQKVKPSRKNKKKRNKGASSEVSTGGFYATSNISASPGRPGRHPQFGYARNIFGNIQERDSFNEDRNNEYYQSSKQQERYDYGSHDPEDENY